MTHSVRLAAAASIILIAGGLASAAVACVPMATLHSFGPLVRRADDVTPERHARLVHVCLAFAAGGLVSGSLLWRRRREAAAWSQQLAQDLAVALKNAPVTMRSWGPIVWIVIAVGIALRAMHLNDSMAYDESYTFVNLVRQPFYIGIADYNSTNNHLLNTLLMHVSWRLFGDAEWALRLPVFLTGILMLPLIWVWSSRWLGRPAAGVTTALAAISPLLITFSTDARGYILVTAAAIVLDDAASRLRDPRSSKPLAWLQAVLAAALGLCAMPIMLYAIVSTTAWLVVSGFREQRSPASPKKPGFWPVASAILLFCLIVGAMYSPAYVFRGTRALHDQVLKPVTLLDQTTAQWTSLLGGWEWWITGVVPWWAWLISLIAGVGLFNTTRADRLRWLAPFASLLALNLIGSVSPPPRVYIIAFPWIALLAGAGVAAVTLRLLRRISEREPGSSPGRLVRATSIVAIAILVAGCVHTVRQPVLLYPAERTSFVSVREALLDLKERIAAEPQSRHRLIAPLPCDLPSIFYREREHIPIEVNGTPEAGETVWLLTRDGETPAAVLKSPLINLPGLAGDEFRDVAKFQTLILFRLEQD